MEIKIRGKSIFRTLRNNIATLASGMAFRLPVITCPAEGYK